MMGRSILGSKDGMQGSGFELTPHKIAVCQLIHSFAPPAQQSIPFPFNSVAQHNCFGLYLISLLRSCDDFVEPSLGELVNQLKAVDASVSDWLTGQLVGSLSALSSPDDLFNFFDKLRGVLSIPDGTNIEDDQIFLDPNTQLGMFLRCCILSFNLLSFEGVCHLLTNVGTYCNTCDTTYDLSEEDYGNELHEFLENDEMDSRSSPLRMYGRAFETEPRSGESSSSHQRAPYYSIEDIQIALHPNFKHNDDSVQDTEYASILSDTIVSGDHPGFLRSKSQVEGYLNAQADCLEKDATSLPLNSFTGSLKRLQKLHPDLYRVLYLQYLNGLHHEDYTTALDNLHSYYDYSAGMEGIFSRLCTSMKEPLLGRYETAPLCLGILHCHFGHSKKALEALTEAVRISQQNFDDYCLAYTSAAICNLLTDVGISSSIGVIGSPYSLGTITELGTPLSAQQQLLVLLKMSLKRADNLKLSSLMAFIRLTLAKFDLKHVKRPLLSFGPKAPWKLKTEPVSVCKELRLSSHVISEFASEGTILSFEDSSFSTSWIKNLTAFTSNLQEDLKTSSTNDYGAFHFGAQPNAVPASVLQLTGSSYLLKAISWEFYGSAPLVRTNALVYATCFADAASSTDLSLAYAKLIQHLAVFKGYKEAFAALKLAEQQFLSVPKSPIHLLKLQLLHEHALHRGKLKVAQQVCDEFGVLASSISGVDMELKLEACLRLARTLLAANQFSQAAAVAHALFCSCYKYKMQIENATILLLLAQIHLKSGSAVVGIPYALASLSFCQSFNLDLLQASASLTLAELWLSLGPSHAQRALNLVYQSLPMILAHGGLELCGRAGIVAAKCHLSDPNFSKYDVVLDSLNQAAEELEILEYHEMAAEAFYLKAIIYDNLGQLEEREAAAASFRQHLVALGQS